MLVTRLVKGCDLKDSIEELCTLNQIQAAIVVCSVGSLMNFKVRVSDGVSLKTFEGHFEIISINGTIANGKSHLHISVSDIDGNCFGGHLVKGNIINTTCELVIMEIKEYNFSREYDDTTKYKELVVKKIAR